MLSTTHILSVIGLALPALAQTELDWAINFYTTGDCLAAQPHWSRLYHGGYSGKNNGDCIGITSPAADCAVTYSGTGSATVPAGVNVYSCNGPNGEGLSGAPLNSFGGEGSCDFYTDSKCTQGHVHINLASYTGLLGEQEPVCYSGKNLLTTKYFQSFKCEPASK